MVVFAVCWIQLTANVLVYFLRNGNHSNFDSRRFPLQPRAFKSDRESRKLPSSNLRPGKNKTDEGKKPSLTVLSLEAELLELSKRLERVQKNVEDTIPNQGSSSETEKVFFPFTIRDAQRTVPTQIPYGFEVFDFIDLYATNGDQNQTAALHSPNNNQKAKFYRNGKPISVDDRLLSECSGYSKRCYRSKFLTVIRYLLSKHNTHKRKGDEENTKEYYYFYMEADNDLCVPLNEIRDIAFEHQRYFVSAGTGASGWIMSHKFLEDFYFFWKNLDENNTKQGLTKDQILEPDSVAAVLLKQNMDWSVTRRYLTSHSILTGNTNDAASIRALFQKVEQVVPKKDDSAAKSDVEEFKKTKKTKRKKKETPEEAAKNAPLMEPSRYLPRCLEPHRGVWRNKMDETNVENNFDMHHWGFFDYDLCPDSDIFPCAEGQLKELAKNDPYFHKKKNQ